MTPHGQPPLKNMLPTKSKKSTQKVNESQTSFFWRENKILVKSQIKKSQQKSNLLGHELAPHFCLHTTHLEFPALFDMRFLPFHMQRHYYSEYEFSVKNLVAKSITIGGWDLPGNATASGFVPSIASAPKRGTTSWLGSMWERENYLRCVGAGETN